MLLENLPSDLVTQIATYLDLPSSQRLTFTCKALSQILLDRNYWRQLLKRSSSTPIKGVGSLYNFQSEPGLKSILFSNVVGYEPLTLYVSACQSIDVAEHILKRTLKSSTHDINQDIDCTSNYDDSLFWSSIGSDREQNEWGTLELYEVSIVHAVQFACYRAHYQGGILYPPQKVQIKIGNSPENWHYQSPIFVVEATDEPQTILILPEIVLGQYVHLEFIGKTMRQPEDELYYTVIDYITVIGKPISETPLRVNCEPEDHPLKFSKTQQILNLDITMDVLGASRLFRRMTPWLASQLVVTQELKKLIEVVKHNFQLPKLMSLFYCIKLMDPSNIEPIMLRGLTISEAIGNYLFSLGHIQLAFRIFTMVGCTKEILKCFIVQRLWQEIAGYLDDDNPRIPKLEEVFAQAKELGKEQEFVEGMSLTHLRQRLLDLIA